MKKTQYLNKVRRLLNLFLKSFENIKKTKIFLVKCLEFLRKVNFYL